VVRNLQQWGHVNNLYDLCILQFHYRLYSFHWKANWWSSRSGRRKSRCRIRAGW
jgi:hypothetical protein